MEKPSFFVTIASVLVAFSVLVFGYTYLRMNGGGFSMFENWTSIGGNYYHNEWFEYVSGVGWSGGYGDWKGTKKEGFVEDMKEGIEVGDDTWNYFMSLKKPDSSYNMVLERRKGGPQTDKSDTVGIKADSGNVNMDADGNPVLGSWADTTWTADREGDNGIDINSIFHSSWLEGEYGKNGEEKYNPTSEDTRYRLGGGWGYSPDPLATAPLDDSYGKINGDLTFYAPGTFMFGAGGYVPSYENSVLLSPMLGVNAPDHNQKKGFGSVGGSGGWTNATNADGYPYNYVDRQKRQIEYDSKNTVCDNVAQGIATVMDQEEYCSTMNNDPKKCGTSACCVSLGGSVCLAGDAQGPLNKTAYTNPMYGRKDYYVYNGRCYGNCPSYLRLDLESSPVVFGNVDFGDNVDTGNWVLGNKVVGNVFTGNVFTGNVFTGNVFTGNVFSGNVAGNVDGNVTVTSRVTGASDINILASTIQTVDKT